MILKLSLLRMMLRPAVLALSLLLVLVIGLPLFIVAGFLPSDRCRVANGGDFNADQLAIARTIVDVGRQLQLPDRGVVAGLMAGIGESSLRNLSHGDAARNDTIGVFQIGPEHGTYAQRMDPAWSAGNFFKRLTAVAGWETLPETIAIHKAQRNKDPNHYQRYLEAANGLFGLIAGGSGDCRAPSTDSTGASGVKAWGGFVNGMIPVEVLCPIPWKFGIRTRDGSGLYARCDYVKALTALNVEYKARFGRDIDMTTAYRSQAYQRDLCSRVTHACAAPGKSVHGLALAIDFSGGINRVNTAEHQWMVANAGRFGIVHPAWAQKPGKGFEPWHWEFNPDLGVRVGVVTQLDRQVASDADPFTRP